MTRKVTISAFHLHLAPPQGPARTSALLAPNMLLTGHADQVFTLRFNPAGDLIATGSFDKTILVYRVYGECENVLQIKGDQALGVLRGGWVAVGGRMKSVLVRT